MHCGKCNAVFYCSRECQTQNWRLHKRVCSPDPLLRPFLRVEMAVERALAKEPKLRAPKDACCYICLEGDGESKLMRGCACRGDSAGFVHVECLVELGMRKEATGDGDAILQALLQCLNCKQPFAGALGIEIQRRFWRRHRSSPNLNLRYHSAGPLAIQLRKNGESDAAQHLYDEATKCIGNDQGALLDMKLKKADLLSNTGKQLQALELLQAMLPEVKEMKSPAYLWQLMDQKARVLLDLNRNQEALNITADLVGRFNATLGLEHNRTLQARLLYAIACAKLGRVKESKGVFKDILTTEIRVYGRDYPLTQATVRWMHYFRFPVPAAAAAG